MGKIKIYHKINSYTSQSNHTKVLIMLCACINARKIIFRVWCIKYKFMLHSSKHSSLLLRSLYAISERLNIMHMYEAVPNIVG